MVPCSQDADFTVKPCDAVMLDHILKMVVCVLVPRHVFVCVYRVIVKDYF